MSRSEIEFGSGGDRCAAWLYPARDADASSPVVVMAHGLSGTRRDGLGPFAERFAAAAGDRRVAAAVSQVPFLDMVRQAHRSSPAVSARVLLAAVRGRHLPAVGQPGEAAFINAPGGEEGWRRVVAGGEDSRWRNRVSSRWLLGRPYRPARHAAGLHCPWLLCVGEADRVARPGPAIAAARRAPRGELRTYPGVDHFDIYDGSGFEAVVADEIEFLRRHLLAAP